MPSSGSVHWPGAATAALRTDMGPPYPRPATCTGHGEARPGLPSLVAGVPPRSLDAVSAADFPLIGAAATRAREAARVLRTVPTETKDAALAAMAEALLDRADEVLAANAADVEAAAADGTPASVLDRLRLDPARLSGVADALHQLIALPDPVGDVVRGSTLANGLQLRQVRVPLGVVGIVYEARPNVTVDAAGLCLKSGNAALLRGSASAHRTNTALVAVLTEAAEKAGLPAGSIALLPADRASVGELLHARGLVDVVIPRGGASLIARVVEESTVL